MYGEMLLSLPVLLPLLGAPLGYILHKKNQAMGDGFSIIICMALLALSIMLTMGVAEGAVYELALPAFGGFGLHLKLDGFRAIYLSITAFMWLCATLFGREYFSHDENPERFHFFSLLTLAATAGTFLSANLLTTFLFFEWVSLCSYALVAYDKSAKALRAASTYIAIAVIGGLTMLMGLFLLYGMAGTLEISGLAAACAQVTDKTQLYIATALLMVGFGAKAGVFPLHIWLPEAHPAAPAPASALLSGVLTKTGVFGVIIISCELLPADINWGIVMLYFGTITMLLGAVLALLSIDLKRTLACSSISQIGFIVVGIAAQTLLDHHNALAVRGTLLHMVNHSLVKLLLFTAAGVIYMNLHKLDLNDIKGWGKDKPLLAAAFLIGGLNLAGVPFFSGYISKTLLHESLVEAIHMYEGQPIANTIQIAEILFLFAGGLTAAYVAKLFIALFVEKPVNALPKKASYMSPLTAIVIGATAAILPIVGMAPHKLAERLAAFGEGFMHGHEPDHAVHYLEWINLKGAVISLTIGALIYIVVVQKLLMVKKADGSKVYVDRWHNLLNLENLIYRPLLKAIYAVLVLAFSLTAVRTDKPTSKFYEKYYWLFYPAKDNNYMKPSESASFSFSLLLMGVGLCAVLTWALWVYIGI